MNRRHALALLAATPFGRKSTPVSAGGFGVIYLLGEQPVAIAGEPWTVRFVVLGHDMVDHLWGGFPVTMELTPKDGGEAITFDLPESSSRDHAYSMTVSIPDPGPYKWSLRAMPWEPTYFPTLEVREPESRATPIVDGHCMVQIRSTGFDPAELSIVVGERVTWVNRDQVAQQVTWAAPVLDDSSLLRPGAEFTTLFETVGSYAYFSGPFPQFTGTVIVKDA